MTGRRGALRKSLAVLGGIALSAALFEGASAYLMLRGLSRSSPPLLLDYFRAYYWLSPYRQVIQLDPDCAVYDKEVFYRLKPGRCVHSGLRFRNEYSINSLGVRDDERSLETPRIISIGDSHAMGWSVDQSLTYAKLIERATGLRTLNMGIASYGTVRKLTLLRRADRSRLDYLLIQYDDNDLPENLSFLQDRGRLKISPERDWQFQSARERRRRYYPGENCVGLIRLAIGHRGLTPEQTYWIKNRRDADVHAWAFLSVLDRLDSPELRKARIIVFDVRNEFHPSISAEESFASAVERALASGRFRKLAGRITPIDLAARLNDPEVRNVIDNHINAQGHRLVAEAILKLIKRPV